MSCDVGCPEQSIENDKRMIALRIWIPFDKRDGVECLQSSFQIRHY